jgi:hypothetical protein
MQRQKSVGQLEIKYQTAWIVEKERVEGMPISMEAAPRVHAPMEKRTF